MDGYPGINDIILNGRRNTENKSSNDDSRKYTGFGNFIALIRLTANFG